MKVALVFPRMTGPRSTTSSLASEECLGLAYLASSLRHEGHEVCIINGELENLDSGQTIERCLSFAPDVVGCSPVSLSIGKTLAVTKALKEEAPDILTILGGHLASLAATEIVTGEPSVDLVLRGDAEHSLCDTLKQLATDRRWDGIPGAVWRDSTGSPRISPAPMVMPNLDDLPPPARDDLRRIATLRGATPAARMVASRGCMFRCSFCTTPGFYGRKIRTRSPVEIVREMAQLQSEFGVTHIWFNDDLFIDGSRRNAKWVSSFANELERSSQVFTFRILCRADSFRNTNIHLLPELKNVGLTHVFIGLEAGNSHSLQVYQKDYEPEVARRAVGIVKDTGLELQIGFIMYNPYSTLDDLRQNLLFLKDIEELYRFFPLTRPLSVFPNTPIAYKLLKDGLMAKMDYADPLSTYRYVDPRVGIIAEEMYKAHDDFSWLDNTLHKELHRPNLRSFGLRRAVAELNLDYYSGILSTAEAGSSDLQLDVSNRIENWMRDLALFTEARQQEVVA